MVATNRRLDALVGLAKDLLKLCGQIDPSQVVKEQLKSPRAYACLFFMLSQQIRLESVVSLIREEQHLDAGTIARSMFEGEYVLKWLLLEELRANLWAHRSIVDKYLSLLEHRRRGIPIDPDAEMFVLKHISSVGTHFLTKKGKAVQQRGDVVDEGCFTKTWPPQSFEGIINEVIEDETKGQDVSADHRKYLQAVYYKYYRALSGWIHWASISLEPLLPGKDLNQLSFVSRDFRIADMSLFAGVHALLFTLKMLNEHVPCGLESELMNIDKTFAGLLQD